MNASNVFNVVDLTTYSTEDIRSDTKVKCFQPEEDDEDMDDKYLRSSQYKLNEDWLYNFTFSGLSSMDYEENPGQLLPVQFVWDNSQNNSSSLVTILSWSTKRARVFAHLNCPIPITYSLIVKHLQNPGKITFITKAPQDCRHKWMRWPHSKSITSDYSWWCTIQLLRLHILTAKR